MRYLHFQVYSANWTSEDPLNRRPLSVGTEQHCCSVTFGCYRNGSLVQFAYVSGLGCAVPQLMALPEAAEFHSYKQLIIIKFYEVFISFLWKKFYVDFITSVYCTQG